jgi:streptomycin 6-kinase
MFVIPDDFARKMIALGGDDGRAWIERLPSILAACEERWGLTIGLPFDLSYNYVAPAVRSDGTAVVVKACLPDGESTQVEALRLFDGRGMVRLLEYDESEEVMLLERLRPGTLLSTLARLSLKMESRYRRGGETSWLMPPPQRFPASP